jgi:hypothetical protein
MAKIIKVEPLPSQGCEVWIAIGYDDGSSENRQLRPFDVVPQLDADDAGPPAAPPDPHSKPTQRVQFTVVNGGKRA